MRPANFPARKDARRQRALTRLVAYGTKGKLTAEQVGDAADKLALKLNGNARAARSKKLRGQRRQAV